MRARTIFAQFLVAIGVTFALMRAIGGIAHYMEGPRVGAVDMAKPLVMRSASR